jgi:hypothetical protein
MQLDVPPFGGLRRGLRAADCAFWGATAPLGPH